MDFILFMLFLGYVCITTIFLVIFGILFLTDGIRNKEEFCILLLSVIFWPICLLGYAIKMFIDLPLRSDENE